MIRQYNKNKPSVVKNQFHVLKKFKVISFECTEAMSRQVNIYRGIFKGKDCNRYSFLSLLLHYNNIVKAIAITSSFNGVTQYKKNLWISAKANVLYFQVIAEQPLYVAFLPNIPIFSGVDNSCYSFIPLPDGTYLLSISTVL